MSILRMVAPLGCRPSQWEGAVSFNGEAWPCLQMVPRWPPVATVRFGPAWMLVLPGYRRRTLTPTHTCMITLVMPGWRFTSPKKQPKGLGGSRRPRRFCQGHGLRFSECDFVGYPGIPEYWEIYWKYRF